MSKIRLILIVFSILGSTFSASALVRFHFIDVGHGDAILIEENGAGIALVDAGRSEYGALVQQYIKDLGIDRIEQLYVTHTHEDHVGGVPEVLDNLAVGAIYHTGMMQDWDEAVKFRDYLDKGLWTVEVVAEGAVTFDDGQLTIEVLNPPEGAALEPDCDANANSMVLQVTYQDISVLLPADINGDAELRLVERYGERLRSQAMKAPHHASFMGNQAELLQAVRPDIMVVTVGPNNWGYPSEETMQRLKEAVPTVLRTDRDGTVILETDGKTITLKQP